MDDDNECGTEFKIHVSSLAEHIDPFDGFEWDCDAIDPDRVLAAVVANDLEEDNWQAVNRLNRHRTFDDVGFHVRRIAYLYVNGGEGSLWIEIERFENRRRPRIIDGNHRFAAAILRHDAYVEVSLSESDVADFREMFPEAVPVLPRARPSDRILAL